MDRESLPLTPQNWYLRGGGAQNKASRTSLSSRALSPPSGDLESKGCQIEESWGATRPGLSPDVRWGGAVYSPRRPADRTPHS